MAGVNFTLISNQIIHLAVVAKLYSYIQFLNVTVCGISESNYAILFGSVPFVLSFQRAL